MLKLVVCIIVLTAVCFAQEHLTCLRTDDVLNRQSQQHSQRALQGSPGKRGTRGQVGSRGSPGQKGEPGIPDDQQIKLLRDQLNSLSQEVEAIKNQSRENRQLAVDVFTKGLYIPPHVYIYRLTPAQQSWQQSPVKRGQVGSRGSPGQKGEPGIPDDQQIKLLRDQLDSLSQEVEALKNQSRENLSQEVEALKNQSRENRQLAVGEFIKGLYIPPHVYIYQLTSARQSWQQSQEFCRNWGGTLAVHGVKTRENRKTLIQNLSIGNIYFWIGVNDIASEGNWVWVNGERASSSELIWESGQPDAGRNENCVAVHGHPTSSSDGLADDTDDTCKLSIIRGGFPSYTYITSASPEMSADIVVLS